MINCYLKISNCNINLHKKNEIKKNNNLMKLSFLSYDKVLKISVASNKCLLSKYLKAK